MIVHNLFDLFIVYFFAIVIMATFPSSSFENKSFLPLVTSTTEPMGNCLSSVTSFNEVSSWFTKTHLFL
jgi:hypothetical protein